MEMETKRETLAVGWTVKQGPCVHIHCEICVRCEGLHVLLFVWCVA